MKVNWRVQNLVTSQYQNKAKSKPKKDKYIEEEHCYSDAETIASVAYWTSCV
jgi:hypothetical protein